MSRHDQFSTPYLDALFEYVSDGVVSFHTPGHKHGVGMHRRLRDFIGENVLKIDLTQILGLDDLSQPEGPIKAAHALAADAYGADRTYFLVNGSTAGNQAMLMSALRPGDIVLLPRNSHKSALSALIMSGARPVYLKPELDRELFVDHAVTPATVEAGLRAEPTAAAVFVTSPTYYGATADLEAIAEIVHAHGAVLLVDEAWGAHLHFHPELPQSATAAKADACVNSTHKLLGAMSQAAMLHVVGTRIDTGRLEATLRIFASTSPQLVLIASLDVARMQMATEGEALLGRALLLARDARMRLNAIPGISCMGPERIGQPGVAGYDETRIVVHVASLGLTGYEADQILRERYKIQFDLSDHFNLVGTITIGDTEESVDALITAISALAAERTSGSLKYDAAAQAARAHSAFSLPPIPLAVVTPREAFLSEYVEVPFNESAGRICVEVITPYPPGIPIICPGERITDETIEYLSRELRAGVHIQGPVDDSLRTVRVLP